LLTAFIFLRDFWPIKNLFDYRLSERPRQDNCAETIASTYFSPSPTNKFANRRSCHESIKHVFRTGITASEVNANLNIYDPI